PDDQERRATEDAADAVRDRARVDGTRRSAARVVSRSCGQHPVLRTTAPEAAGGPGGRSGDAVGRSAGRRNGSIPVQIEGKAYPQESDYPSAREGIVTPGYFETFQTTVHSGREFTTRDTAAGQPVAIVNQSFARLHFAGVDPVVARSSGSGRTRQNRG
ncbi:MAG: hypothetical protein H0W08_08490, partial [Acidobacteria bacterium]|nr:hypothetical protein [Acidobacteriota bacterium]